MLVANKETVIRGVTDSLSATGRSCEMEINVEKTTVMRTSRKLTQLQIMINPKQLENVSYFKYFSSK